MKILAPAKINLSLDIVGHRSDGYHTLDMVMQSISLFDTVSVERTGKGLIEVMCSEKDVPCGSDNTVHRAAAAFFEAMKTLPESGLLFHIEKHIPRQAGLGGGSSDAAAALLLLDQMYRTSLSKVELREIGLSAGADVPFCVEGGTALVRGIGEIIEPVAPMRECSIVVCRPDVGISTKEAYDAYDHKKTVKAPHTPAVLSALKADNLPILGAALGNAFEGADTPTEISKIEAEMLRFGATGARMTGSGSAVFGLFENPAQAELCLSNLLKNYSAAFLCGPVPGRPLN